MNKGELIEQKEEYFVLRIPVNAVNMQIIIDIYQNKELITIEKQLDFEKIRDGFRLAKENFEDPETEYTLSEEGRRFLEKFWRINFEI